MKTLLLLIISSALSMVVGCKPISNPPSTTTTPQEEKPLMDDGEDKDKENTSSQRNFNGLQHLVVEQKTATASSAQFLIFFVNNGQRLNHTEFLETMSTDEGFAKRSMREFATIIRAENLDKCGFGFHASNEKEHFFLSIHGKPSTAACKTAIYPGQTYSAPHQYTNILNGNEHINNRKDSKHAIAFNSASMTSSNIRRLIIPKGPYVTIYDFAEKASSEEISDFFALVKAEVKRLFIDTSLPFTYEVHTGSDYAQAVPHFHLRIYQK